MTTPIYTTISDGYPTVLGKITSDYYNTYTGIGYLDEGQQCFCQDGCNTSNMSCGKCSSEQLCNNCNLNYSGYCQQTPYYGGLGWT